MPRSIKPSVHWPRCHHVDASFPELRKQGMSRYREVLARPFRIIYRVSGRDVHVLAIVDHRRDITQLLLERARR